MESEEAMNRSKVAGDHQEESAERGKPDEKQKTIKADKQQQHTMKKKMNQKGEDEKSAHEELIGEVVAINRETEKLMSAKWND